MLKCLNYLRKIKKKLEKTLNLCGYALETIIALALLVTQIFTYWY